MIGAIVIIMLALGGGVSFEAQHALPGDMLYPIKVGVNEKIEGALALSADAKANWETTLAERRLDEAGKLSAEGKLDANVAADLNSEFSSHAEAALAAAAQNGSAQGVANKEAADVEARLEAAEQAHADLFGGVRVAAGDINGDGKANARAAFVLPHVLEVTARETGTGMATGRTSADVSADGSADTTVHSDSGSTKADADTPVQSGGGSASVRGTVNVKLGK